MNRNISYFWIVCFLLAATSTRGEDLNVLTEENASVPPREMLTVYLRKLTEVEFDRREREFEELIPAGSAAMGRWQFVLREKFIERLGGFPERTPLNPQIVGTVTGRGYKIEKIIFESRPQFFVTANLYLPLTPGPYPGILFPCGHSENGKAAEAYQRTCMLLARTGMAVLIYDPVGQGERKQILKRDDSGLPIAEGVFPSTSEHTITGVAPILLGESLATYRIWDGMRGIDYLCSRPDIDPKRIGCTGNSGGGLMTSYLMALDTRIKAAAPGCFITTTRRKNISPGPGDAEQNIFGQIADGLDHPDYIKLAAPSSVLVLSATKDFVPIQGAWEAFREAKRYYTAMGIPERVNLVEANEKHGYTRPLRTAAARWMSRWLKDIDADVPEFDLPIHGDEELQCTPHGQVLLLAGARSLTDLYVERAAALKARRIPREPDVQRQQIQAIVQMREQKEIVKLERVGVVERKGYKIEKMILKPEPGIVLPVLLFRPEKPNAMLRLYVHGDGKHVDAGVGGPIEQLVLAGDTVAAVDLRGDGETETKAWRFSEAYAGANAAEYFVAYMLGRSLVAMRADDVLSAVKAVSAMESNVVRVIAIGDAGVPVLHAAALYPEWFRNVTLRNSITSWETVVKTPVSIRQLENTVHGAMKVYDLPDLMDMMQIDGLVIENPVDAAGKGVSVPEAN